MNFKILILISILLSATQSKIDAKSLRIENTLDIFLLELLPFKAQFILKNVEKNCSRALTPLIDDCYKEYELNSKYTLEMSGTVNELKVGCCNLWKYHECVISAVERLAHYSFKLCSEFDAEATEEILEATEAHPKSKLMCSQYRKQSFYCANFVELSLGLVAILVVGLGAILVAIFLAGFMFYLSTLPTNLVYLRARARRNQNDVGELLDRENEDQ